MPALSPTMEEGTLAKWHVKEGDAISAGDIIAEIETDKATMEIESIDDGIMGEILVPEGTEGVKVNATIGTIFEDGETKADVTEKPAPVSAQSEPVTPSAPPPAVAPVVAAAAPVQAAAPPPAPSSGRERVFASPLAKRLAEQQGIDLSTLQGTGPRGRIVKSDIEKAGQFAPAKAAPTDRVEPQPVQSPTEITPVTPRPVPAPIPAGDYIEVPLDSIRKIVAARLTESKQTVPHFYLTIECQIDRLLDLRRELNAKSPDGEAGYKISVNDFIIRASALALKKVPDANASWTDKALLKYLHADIAVAVAIEGGLITPVIRQAEFKGLSVIANEMKDLGERARNRKLMPEEYQGGSFSISNLGMYGIKEFSAVINPPHGAILAVGAGEERPVVQDGALAVATMMNVTLSCDHRVIDGAVGATFLAAFKGYIEDPLTMML
jgi:pyruvate dehydrogenase E2 component (dihydrolipoamide acetyltransferase)